MLNFGDHINIIYSHQSGWPVKVIPIANALGMKVYYTEGWENEISGLIKRESEEEGRKNSYGIYVNESHSYVRRRFTIAHEIAHFILHRDRIGNKLYEDYMLRGGLSNKEEVEANYFAADILMPWHLITRAMDEGITTIEDLSSAFEVSKSAMSIRLGVPYEP